MKLEIEPLTLRSATWLAANMRPQDEAELMCQLPPGTSRSDAGAACFFTSGDGWKWQAIIDGSPVACFGVSQLTYTTWVGWGFGRPQMRRAMPEVTRFLKAQLPRLIEAGCRRIEARALKSHEGAHLWLASLGGTYRFDLGDGGRDGEVFEFWSWELTEWLTKNKQPQAATPSSAQ